ncbi:MAG: hypothetical protein EPO11_04130 [Gammaproteobacteria bacterium]|nr:MAG: hypothetical protein EPO11_04130 [Gammaproteobacteria bacterium]
MKPTLILQPIHQSSADILRCFSAGKPLTANQLNFLDWHQEQLSSKEFDPVLKYYLESTRLHQQQHRTTFLLHHEILNAEAIQQLKKRITLFLQEKAQRVVIDFTSEQFSQFEQFNKDELVFYPENVILTVAPSFPMEVPPVLFFRWGNFFAVVKYVAVSHGKTFQAKILVYFENRRERLLYECVKAYHEQVMQELNHQREILFQHKIETPSFDKFLIKTPVITLSK